MRIAYAYATTDAMRTAVVRLWTSPQIPPSPGLELEVLEARVKLVADPAPSDPGKVVIRRYERLRPRLP